ncbi:MAG TPA: DNA gyrase subunit A [Candidatus Hydrogenedentes bacterium]|nr:DNA gyrase subunit A [Candidatus Hydrogenedentota bacterium]HQE75784.1 DNA gyrase subunit A [Candidatus Hydrogenedentota bacterium]HQH68129.1 DNA gyrase subunit A [Candidatus Hydrogenedentota bacterium]
MYTRNEKIVPIAIENEMKNSFMDYSMSVIVSRALPDVRDGLKPVHRRILYTMHELGLVHNRGFRKCAAVVGDTMGKYHPHGDSAIYDTLVRLAQPWNMRYPLVQGQGNFGSVDGDSPAAMRYTEARMAAITAEMLGDIEKQTVDMTANYDGRLQEPMVLPSAIPNLLVNGSYGIAVGMATSCPPHNLTEVCDAVVHLIDHPEATTRDLLKFVKGPDFPTGGIICGRAGIENAYRTGHGQVRVRARVSVETNEKTAKESLIVTEIPYQVNKARLIENIADLVRSKKVEGISDLRDESDKDGMRVVIEIRKGDEPQVILNQLFQFTQLQETASIHLLALVNNSPRVLSLRELVHYYIEHRAEIVERRTRFDLTEAEKRAHILEGLLKAIDHIDEVIAIIRASADAESASRALIERFEFSEVQANAILAMRLRRLTGLERDELEKEYADLLKEIERLRNILSSERTIKAEVRKEILQVKEKYGDARRTEILDEVSDFSVEDLIADESMVVTVSSAGYIKRLPVSTYRKQRRGGKGITGMETKEEDFVRDLFIASTHQYMLFFSNAGRVYWRKVHELPKAGRTARGRAIVNLLNLSGEERITACLPVRDLKEDGKNVFMVTRNGTVKKTLLKAFSNPRSAGIIAIDIDEGDQLIDVQITTGEDNILLATAQGKAIRFPEKDVRSMGRSARGVVGIRLEQGDSVIGMSLAADESTVLTVTENGYGKRTKVGEYRLQHRGGQGIINIKTSERNGLVVGMLTVDDDDEIVLVSTDGIVMRCEVKGIRTIGRNTQGVTVMKPNAGAKVSAVAKAVADTKEERITDVPAGEEAPDDGVEETDSEDFESGEEEE